MEGLIILIAPAMLALHAWVPPDRKAMALAGLIFMSLSALITCSVHFAILTLASRPEFVHETLTKRLLSF